jgi:hypothetical protein
MIKRICAWCGALIGLKSERYCNLLELEDQETHGICKSCLQDELGDNYLDHLWWDIGGEAEV